MSTDPTKRNDRLAGRLRENLKRRKAQARARSIPAPTSEEKAGGDAAPDTASRDPEPTPENTR